MVVGFSAELMEGSSPSCHEFKVAEGDRRVPPAAMSAGVGVGVGDGVEELGPGARTLDLTVPIGQPNTAAASS